MRRSGSLGDAPGRVSALCYVVDRAHAQYAGRVRLRINCTTCARAMAKSGANRDYVLSTVQELEALGFRDAQPAILLRGRDARLKSTGALGTRSRRHRQRRAHGRTIRASALSFLDEQPWDALSMACDRQEILSPVPARNRIAGPRPRRSRESGGTERRGQNSPELSATGTQGTPDSA